MTGLSRSDVYVRAEAHRGRVACHSRPLRVRRQPSGCRDRPSDSDGVRVQPHTGRAVTACRALDLLKSRTTICIDQHIHRNDGCRIANYVELSELLVIDEAERLSPTSLEYIQGMHDRIGIGAILIGMP